MIFTLAVVLSRPVPKDSADSLQIPGSHFREHSYGIPFRRVIAREDRPGGTMPSGGRSGDLYEMRPGDPPRPGVVRRLPRSGGVLRPRAPEPAGGRPRPRPVGRSRGDDPRPVAREGGPRPRNPPGARGGETGAP